MSEWVDIIQGLFSSGLTGLIIFALIILSAGAFFLIWIQWQVMKTNGELRKEIDRYRNDQVKFETEVKEAMKIGFNEMKKSVATITVSEIIDQIPIKFRQDLEDELNNAIKGLPENIKKSDIINDKKLGEIIEKSLDSTIPKVIDKYLPDRLNKANKLNEKELKEIVEEAIAPAISQCRINPRESFTDLYIENMSNFIAYHIMTYLRDPDYYHHLEDWYNRRSFYMFRNFK